jgi:serine/threonine protein kinase
VHCTRGQPLVASVGQVEALRNRFRIERELGHGGMALVYLAHDLEHSRRVALKILKPAVAALLGPERFLREIRITGRLQHPNILPLLDSGVSGEVHWYSMPFVEADSLRERLAFAGNRLGVEQVITIGRQIAAALDYANAAGVVHRDVKPANILLEGDHAWIADFGLARMAAGDVDSPITSGSLVVGTPFYMSPEQARGGGTPVDSRTDVYSLGCVLYEMLAGEPPFNGPTRESILSRHALDPVPPIVTVRPEVGRGADEVLRTTLAKSPGERFATAGQTLSALEVALRGSKRPTPLPDRFVRHEDSAP